MPFLRRWSFRACFLLMALLLGACSPAGSGPLPVTSPRPTATLVMLPTATATSPAAEPSEPVLGLGISNASGQSVERTVDGNALRLAATLAEPSGDAATIEFRLGGAGAGDAALGQCTIVQGERGCELPLRADGWAWEARQQVGTRTVTAVLRGGAAVAEKVIAVVPKPIVLVHGLNSDETSWINWIKPGGYLEARGLPGYAVDDRQFGTRRMNTGIPSQPKMPTFSIAENAQVLAEYVEAVRQNTGAERVDLVAHSLGGLISRYYVQNLMPAVNAAGLADAPVANQLFMAGTPNGGTQCGRIPAAIGLFAPATTQITPEYLGQVFNPTVRDRRGVPFFAIAGDAVRKAIAIRCTELPTDRYVSVRSVLQGVAVSPEQIEGIHSDLNNREDSFERIFRSLARSPEDYPIRMVGETTPANAPEQVQSTLVQAGTLAAGETVSVTLTIDQARSASFILLAPGSQVSMTIKTVAGAILTEATPLTNPNVTFERVLDESEPLSLGYGVVNPRAGAWEIGLTARETPPGGGPFAVLATMDSDLQMSAAASLGTTAVGQPVQIRAALAGAAQDVIMRAELRSATPGAEPLTVDMTAFGDEYVVLWNPVAAGEYTVVVQAEGRDGAGNPFERLSVLGVSVTE